ncbi:MAG: glycosyltransferase family 2 protein, partial [Pseudanabaena sp. SU_2_4]|nr:glycosyltransferase family 2 protein [Pseudanabaena sp. SU_2_4]
MALGLPLLRNFYQSQRIAQSNIPTKPNPPVAVKNDSFYFLAEATYEDAGTAKLHAEALKANGFNQAGVFKLSDYPNLKGRVNVQVYVAKFDRISSCVAQLKLYVSQKPDAYCALASSDASKSTEQVVGSAVQPTKQQEPNQAVLATTTPEQAVKEYYDLINNHNYGRFVGEAIESALAQTHPNVEVIVIDDGSTDDSLSVIKSFGDRIRWETGPNRGGCAARNRGIELARGALVQFLDADDLLYPLKLARMVPLAINGGSGCMTICDGELLPEGGSEVKQFRLNYRGEDPVTFCLRKMPHTASVLHWKCDL